MRRAVKAQENCRRGIRVDVGSNPATSTKKGFTCWNCNDTGLDAGQEICKVCWGKHIIN